MKTAVQLLAAAALAALLFTAGYLIGRHKGRLLEPSTISTRKSQSPAGCSLVQYQHFVTRPGAQPLWAEWELCSQNSPVDQTVRITDDAIRGNEVFSFGPADLIEQLRVVELQEGGGQQLLMQSLAAGTGEHIAWCVFGWTGKGNACWSVPDIKSPSRHLLGVDEDFCCKDWTLKLRANRIVLGRGIYKKGEANCCPSRGGAYVELLPDHGRFRLGRVWRSDRKQYDTWLEVL